MEKEIILIGSNQEELLKQVPSEFIKKNPSLVKSYQSPGFILNNRLRKPGTIILGDLSIEDINPILGRLKRYYPYTEIVCHNPEKGRLTDAYNFFLKENFFPGRFTWNSILHWGVVGMFSTGLLSIMKGSGLF